MYRVAIGDNDAHAKTVALIHRPGGTELAPVYDAVPNLFQDGRAVWNLALAVAGVFDHRRISVDRILAEVKSGETISEDRASEAIAGVLDRLGAALEDVEPPEGISSGLPDHLLWTVSRLRSGQEISQPKR